MIQDLFQKLSNERFDLRLINDSIVVTDCFKLSGFPEKYYINKDSVIIKYPTLSYNKRVDRVGFEKIINRRLKMVEYSDLDDLYSLVEAFILNTGLGNLPLKDGSKRTVWQVIQNYKKKKARYEVVNKDELEKLYLKEVSVDGGSKS